MTGTPRGMVGVSDHRDLTTEHPGLVAALAAATEPAATCKHADNHVLHAEVQTVDFDPFDGGTQREHHVQLRVWCGRCGTPFEFGPRTTVFTSPDHQTLTVSTAPRGVIP